MKIKNIFKKETKTAVKANVEKLEKNQLEKLIGGVSETSITDPSKPMVGGVISSTVSSVSNTKGGTSSGAASASYA